MKVVRPPLPGGYVIYCDDLREEIGNKTSIIGSYGGEMTAFGSAPIRLARLCALVAIRLDPNDLPSDFTVRIVRLTPNEELELIGEAKAVIPDAARQMVLGLPPACDPEAQRFIEMRISQQFEGLEFSGPCTIATRVEIRDEEYRLGSLEVKLAPREEAPNLLSSQRSVESEPIKKKPKKRPRK